MEIFPLKGGEGKQTPIAPYPNFEQVNQSKSLKQRIPEEERMKSLEVATIKKYASIQPEHADAVISEETRGNSQVSWRSEI